jgi:ABC-type transporter Mla MlaB component
MSTASPIGPLYDDGLLRITWLSQVRGFRVEGTVDAATRSGLDAALAAVQPGDADIHVDLSGLEFIDMEGLRLLVRAARNLAAGRMLLLQRVPAYVQTLLHAVNWDDTPGLRIEGVQA